MIDQNEKVSSNMKEPFGYTETLFLLPFDHRGSFKRDIFNISDREVTDSERELIKSFKVVIYQGLIRAVALGVPKDVSGILVDEEFGSEILGSAKSQGYLRACCVEKSGQNIFDFEYGKEFKQHLLSVKPDFAKALVRYNPEDQSGINDQQLKRLKVLSDFCRENAFRFMFELLVPATPQQLSKVENLGLRYDRDLRPELMVGALKAIQDFGIEPDVWKVEGVHSIEAYKTISQQARFNGRDNVALIVLGHGKDEEAIRTWLRLAAQVAGFRGFAIGRTVWEKALIELKAGRISRMDASEMIANEYKLFCDLWVSTQAATG